MIGTRNMTNPTADGTTTKSRARNVCVNPARIPFLLPTAAILLKVGKMAVAMEEAKMPLGSNITIHA